MDLSSRLLAIALRGGAEWVLYLLLALSVLSVMVLVERVIVLRATRSDVARLQGVLGRFVARGDVEKTLEALSSVRGVEASVLRQGLERAAAGADSVEEVVAGLIGLERAKLERGVAFLGTVGSNAPFIGLFGTVLGVMKAFDDLAKNAGGGAEVVMASISEALLATAVGLMVAIPAVMAYNYLQRRIKRRMARLTALSHLLLAGLRSGR